MTVTSAFGNMLGCPNDSELVGQDIWDIVSPEDKKEMVSKISAHGHWEECPCRMRMQDGSWKTVLTDGSSWLVGGTLSLLLSINEGETGSKADYEFALNREAAFWKNMPGFSLRFLKGKTMPSPSSVSESILPFLGYTVSEFLSLTFDDFITLCHPDEKDDIREAILRAVEKGDALKKDFRLRKRDGQYVWVSLAASPVMGPHGIVYCCNFLDITKDRQAEQLLSNAYGRAKALVANAPGGIIRCVHAKGKNLHVDFISDGFCRMVRMDREALRSYCKDDLFSICHPDDKPLMELQIVATFQGKRGGLERCRIHCGDGSWIWTAMRTNLHIEKDADERRLSMLYVSFNDISASIKMEADLENEKDFLENFVNAMPGGLVIYHNTGKGMDVEYLSAGFTRITGFNADDVKSMEDKEERIFPADRQILENVIRQSFATGKDTDVIFRMYHKNGTLLWMSLRGKVIDHNAEGYRFLAFYNNISVQTMQYHEIINHSESAVMLIDAKTYEVLFANPKVRELFSAGDYQGRSCHDYLYGNTDVCTFCPLKNEKKQDIMEYKEKVLSCHAVPLLWNERDVFIFYLDDITDHTRLEKVLTGERERLQEIISNIPSGLSVYARQGEKWQEVACNPAFLNLLGVDGIPMDPLHIDAISGFVHPEDLHRLIEKFTSLKMDERTMLSLVFRLKNKKTGIFSWTYLASMVVPGEEGGAMVYASLTDMTRQVEAERQSDRNEEYLKTLYDRLPTMVFQFRNRTEVPYLNPAGKKLMGVAEQADAPIIRNATWRILSKVLHALGEKDEPRQFEFNTTRFDDGSSLCLSGYLFKGNGKGNPPYVAIMEDVTENRALQKELSSLLRHIPGGIALYHMEPDEKVKKLFMSKEAMKTLGYGSDRKKSENTLFGDITEGERKKIVDLFRANLRKGGTTTHEYPLLFPDGSEHWVALSSTIIQAKADGQNYLCVLFSNVDARKRLEAQDKKQQEELLKKMQEELSFQKAAQGKNLVTKARFNITEGTIEEYASSDGRPDAKGLDYDGFISRMEASCLGELYASYVRDLMGREALLKRFSKGIRDVSFELRIKDTASVPCWDEVVMKSYQEPKSGNIKSFLYRYDITEKKTMGLIIDRILTLGYEFFGVLDVETNRLQWFKVSSMEEGGEKGDSVDWSLSLEEFSQRYLEAPDRSPFLSALSVAEIVRQLERNKEYLYSMTVHEKERKKRKQWIFTYLDEQKRLLAVARADISKEFQLQQKRQEELSDALTKAEKASKAKGEFLATMSHDMRTPMNAIIGLTNLALGERECLPLKIATYLENIASAGNLLLLQINDVLDMSKIENATIVLHPEPYAIEDFLTSMDTTLIRPQCVAKKINFIVDRHAFPAKSILVDHVRFNQVFFNLLSNAVKFSNPGGTISFVLSMERTSKGLIGCYRIQDNGIGMSKEFLRNLFLPYQREHEDISGTGLGLYIVKKIVTAMEGTVGVESRAGEGSLFTVRLPLVVVENGSPEVETKDREKTGKLLEGRKVLLVDDNAINVMVAKNLLERKGVIVTVADNGKSALEMFSASAPGFFDMILMDVRMPVMGGLESARTIRQLDRSDARTIPIIAMSANAFQEDIRKSLEAGMNEHLSKPVEPEQLFSRMASYFSAASS
jgi:PAS domain S-box-containing protein